MVEVENYCRFTGKLVSVVRKTAPDGSWVLGQCTLLLPDKDHAFKGQSIKFSCWGDHVDRLEEVGNGRWITILCSYALTLSGGKYYPNFTMDAFIIRDE